MPEPADTAQSATLRRSALPSVAGSFLLWESASGHPVRIRCWPPFEAPVAFRHLWGLGEVGRITGWTWSASSAAGASSSASPRPIRVIFTHPPCIVAALTWHILHHSHTIITPVLSPREILLSTVRDCLHYHFKAREISVSHTNVSRIITQQSGFRRDAKPLRGWVNTAAPILPAPRNAPFLSATRKPNSFPAIRLRSITHRLHGRTRCACRL